MHRFVKHYFFVYYIAHIKDFLWYLKGKILIFFRICCKITMGKFENESEGWCGCSHTKISRIITI